MMEYAEFLKSFESEFTALVNDSDIGSKVRLINELREIIHNNSPFKNEPVDYVKWVKSDLVIANDYNPNSVAPPEMQLLENRLYEQERNRDYADKLDNGDIERCPDCGTPINSHDHCPRCDY